MWKKKQDQESYSPIRCRYLGCQFSDFAQLFIDLLKDGKLPEHLVIYLNSFDYEILDSYDCVNLLDLMNQSWLSKLPIISGYIFRKNIQNKRFLTEQTLDYIQKKVHNRLYGKLFGRED